MVVWVPEGRAPDALEECDFGDWDVWFCNEVPERVRLWIGEGCTFVAHNAESFDAEAWKRFGWGEPEWCDTVHMCRAGAYPAGLDRACKALDLEGKDATGAEALKLLYKASVRYGSVVYPKGTVPLWQSMLRYNVQDVLILEQLYERVRCHGEPDVMALHSLVNETGIPIDIKYAERLHRLWLEHTTQSGKELGDLTDEEINGENIKSVPKVKAWLARHGLVVKTLERKAIEQMMQDPDSFFGDSEDPNVVRVREAILLRQQATKNGASKVERVFSITDPDHRVRGCIVYFGTFTGRFAGRDLQPHNLTRGIAKLDVEKLLALGPTLADVRAEVDRINATLNPNAVIAERRADVGDALATLVRPMIAAPKGKVLGIADFAGIEARGLAWMALSRSMLKALEDVTQDIYVEQAKQLFGSAYQKGNKEQRFVGKQIVLGCGYGMGAAKFKSYAKIQGCDIDKIGLDALACTRAFRTAFPEVVKLWDAVQAAFIAAMGGRPGMAGRCHYQMVGPHLRCTLPSGRPIWYHNPRWEMHVPPWDATAPPRETLCCDGMYSLPKFLYGGLLTNHIVQGASRDLLCDSMRELRRQQNYPIDLHVHDEVVQEFPEDTAAEDIKTMSRIMSTPPAWAAGWPVRVEGFTNRHYTKAPFKASARADFMLGREVKK